MFVSFAEQIREESDELCKNLKEDFVNPEILFDQNYLHDFEQRDREQFEFLCWSYGLKDPSHDDFKEFIEVPSIKELEYARNEYMILYISTYKSTYQRDSNSDKRITFLKFCISKDIFFTEAIFRDYLSWSEENYIDSGLSRWKKMEEYYLNNMVYYKGFDTNTSKIEA